MTKLIVHLKDGKQICGSGRPDYLKLSEFFELRDIDLEKTTCDIDSGVAKVFVNKTEIHFIVTF